MGELEIIVRNNTERAHGSIYTGYPQWGNGTILKLNRKIQQPIQLENVQMT